MNGRGSAPGESPNHRGRERSELPGYSVDCSIVTWGVSIEYLDCPHKHADRLHCIVVKTALCKSLHPARPLIMFLETAVQMELS